MESEAERVFAQPASWMVEFLSRIVRLLFCVSVPSTLEDVQVV